LSGPADALEALRAGGKPALARALAAIEAHIDAPATLALLDAAWAAPRAHVIGITGPPGVGKSTLLSALARHWRQAGRTVGIVAVDPSSRRSGGALLGDRTRLELDPEDGGLFFRSMAARDRLGGIASLTAGAVALMRALYDIVVVETVGVGQSETEVADVVDTVLLAVQPGSGDSLQYIKAGIIEIPDVAVVTKADLGPLASRARRELEAALSLQTQGAGGGRPPIFTAAAATGQGIAELAAALDGHRAQLEATDSLAAHRADRAERWLAATLRYEHGRQGLERARRLWPHLLGDATLSPFRRLVALNAELPNAG
jgi:LAO/AO transport system kinase